MYNVLSKKSLKINNLSIKNVLLLILLVTVTMGFHVWIVCKTLNVLDDVTDIIVINHGKHLIKSLPSETIYILNWDKHLDRQINIHDCRAVRSCIITKDKFYLGKDYTMFDAILYSEWFLESKNRPERSSKTLNIFTSTLPSLNKVACDKYFDDFFNYTFTFRLDSEVVRKYFVVRNLTGDIIAPSVAPTWSTSLNPVPQEIRSIINRKTKAIAYIDSNCKFTSWKKPHVIKLEEHLSKYSVKINVYNCTNKCENERCDVMLRNKYYFNIIFEDYFAEDYVTKKILQAYDNYAVPIVFGGANYNRFLPPHSYINARTENLLDVAAEINETLNNNTHYETFFKWRNIYKIEIHQPFCDLCEHLNEKTKTISAKKNFREWWNGKDGMQLCSLPKFINGTS